MDIEKATKAAKTYALGLGFALRILRTRTVGNKKGAPIKKRILACVHGGKPVVKDRVRNTSTLRQECPFEMVLEKDEAGRWSHRVTCARHNHDMVENVAAYASARTLSDAEKETVENLTHIGASPQMVLAVLRSQNPKNLATVKDIYNVKTSMAKQKELNGRKAIQAYQDSTAAAVQPATFADFLSSIQRRYDMMAPDQRVLLWHALDKFSKQDFSLPNLALPSTSTSAI